MTFCFLKIPTLLVLDWFHLNLKTSLTLLRKILFA
uniref:Uncharacterized protein n=1 Tax=Bacteriophage sp. TaxID=38018 RepID=A0A8D9PEF0_9VIRU|nr:MAG TPA: hypothetical protein [Bacteriophage sp.]